MDRQLLPAPRPPCCKPFRRRHPSLPLLSFLLSVLLACFNPQPLVLAQEAEAHQGYPQDENENNSHEDTLHAHVSREERDQYEQESAQQLRELQVGRILSRLDEREQQIIISRFGLDHNQEPQTLKQVGASMGVTKERIRQIEARALNKLRLAAHEERIDVPD